MISWYITVKDVQLLMRDRRALVLLLVLPIMFIFIVGMTTGQLLTNHESNGRFKIACIDLSHTETSQQLLTEFGRSPELLLIPENSVEEATETMNAGDVSLILIIGPEFESRVEDVRVSDIFDQKEGLTVTGPKALDLTLKTNPNSVMLGRLLEAVTFSQVVRFVVPIAAKKNPLTRAWCKAREDQEQSVSQAEPLATAKNSHLGKSSVYLWVVPGFTVMFAFFLISIMGRSFIIERDQGTLRRLLMAPTSSLSVLLGKTLPFYLTSIIQCSLLFVCGRLLFGMPWGTQPIFLIPVILSTSAAATSLGLLLATLVQTDQQVSSYGTTLILVLSSISGCFFPRELFPQLMKQISLITPHAWSLKAFDTVLTQPVVDPRLVFSSCGMLLLFAAACFATGWLRFRATAQA